MSWPIQDHADAFLTLIRSAVGSPSLTVYDGKVPDGATTPYVQVILDLETPDGATVPDWLSLTLASVAIRVSAIVHCVGGDPEAPRAARAVAGRVRGTVLDQVLTVSGWSCNPVRWIEGQPPQRNEEIPGSTIFDKVDVYGWSATSA